MVCNFDNVLLEETADMFKALGDVNRMMIIYLLASEDMDRVSVTELANLLGITQPAASQHLRTLKSAKIVRARKEGNHTYYAFDREIMMKYKKNVDYLFDCVFLKCDRAEKRG